MEKQGPKIRIRLMSENAGKKVRKEKQVCDETLGDKPWAKDEKVLGFEDG